MRLCGPTDRPVFWFTTRTSRSPSNLIFLDIFAPEKPSRYTITADQEFILLINISTIPRLFALLSLVHRPIIPSNYFFLYFMDRGPFFVEPIARDDFSLEINFCVSLMLNCYCLIFPLFCTLSSRMRLISSTRKINLSIIYHYKFHKNSKTLKIIFLSLL